MNVEAIEVKLVKEGFKDVSYPRLKSQTRLFQLVTDDTNLVVNLSFPGEIQITDGRATLNKIYLKSDYNIDLIQTIKNLKGNLL